MLISGCLVRLLRRSSAKISYYHNFNDILLNRLKNKAVMMRKFSFYGLTIAIALLLCSLPALCGENLLESFDGGTYNILFMQNSALTSGLGVYEAAAGIGITTLRPSPASIFWNPAGLGLLRNGGILIESVPAFSYAPDISESVNDGVDEMLADFDTTGASIYYPSVDIEAGQRAQAVKSLALAFPFKNMYFGLSYHQAFSLGMNMIIAQIENKLTSVEEDSLDNATIFTRTDVNMLLDIDAEVVSFAAGRNFGNKFALGMTFSRTSAVTSINGIVAPEGVFTRRGIEKSFNDPNAGWQNDLYTSMIGDFSGGAWGAKIGFAYLPSDNISLNMCGSFNGQLDLTGEMEVIQYFYSAVNLDADENAGEETFDLTNIENFSQPTETVLADNQPDDHMKLNVPSSIAFGAAFKGISFTFTSYSGELSYEYILARDGNPINYSRGVAPKFGVLFGFDFKYIQVSLGAFGCDEVVKGYKDSEGVPVEPSTGIIIPRFNLGTGFNVGENWKVNVLLFNVPDMFGSVLKVGAVYSFK